MLEIVIPAGEMFNEETNEFVTYDSARIRLEHSLVSISKWESIWHKPFMTSTKNLEETLSYIKCMTLTQNVNDEVYTRLSQKNVDDISNYIDDSHTATWFNTQDNKKASREIITSEVIYYAMIAYGIPFECQKWHLNRLLTLIKVCSTKNDTPKKMGKNEILSKNRELNEARRKAMRTRG